MASTTDRGLGIPAESGGGADRSGETVDVPFQGAMAGLEGDGAGQGVIFRVVTDDGQSSSRLPSSSTYTGGSWATGAVLAGVTAMRTVTGAIRLGRR